LNQQSSFEVLVIDEPWTFAEHLVEIMGRVSAFTASQSWQIIMPSSGPTDGDDFARLIESGEWWEWTPPCDGCNEPMPMRWESPPLTPLGSATGPGREVVKDPELLKIQTDFMSEAIGEWAQRWKEAKDLNP
jgi:hypothetical protein